MIVVIVYNQEKVAKEPIHEQYERKLIDNVAKIEYTDSKIGFLLKDNRTKIIENMSEIKFMFIKG